MNEATTGCVVSTDSPHNIVGVIITRKGAIFVREDLSPTEPNFYNYTQDRASRVADVQRRIREILAPAWRPWIKANFPGREAEALSFVLKVANDNKDFLID